MNIFLSIQRQNGSFIGAVLPATWFSTQKREFNLVSRISQSFLLYSWSQEEPRSQADNFWLCPFSSLLSNLSNSNMGAQCDTFQLSLLDSHLQTLTNYAFCCLTESLLAEDMMWFLLPRVKHTVTGLWNHSFKKMQLWRVQNSRDFCLPFLVCRGEPR